MKRDVFERIEKKLEPQDELVDRLLEKAGELAAQNALKSGNEGKGEISMENNKTGAEIKRGNGLAVSLAAALAVIVGATAIFGIKASVPSDDENSAAHSSVRQNSAEQDIVRETSKPDTAAGEPPETQTAKPETSAPEASAEETDSSSELPATWTAGPETPPPEESAEDDGRADYFYDYERQEYPVWQPQPFADGTIPAIAEESPVSEYRNFEFNGKSYSFACGSYNEVYNQVLDGIGTEENIPNESYIGELIGNAEIPSEFGEIRENEPIEVYSLKYIDSDYLVAVRFLDFNDNQRYFLFADLSFSRESLQQLFYSMNFEKCCFNGNAIMRRKEEYAGIEDYCFIGDDSELAQMILALDGELADAPSGEMVWQIFLDTPLFGSSLSFKLYPDGYVSVKAFGAELTYRCDQSAVEQIISCIDQNGQS